MSADPASDEEEYVDALGVITALERTCELEAKLRQSIQDTHPLTTTLDWDFNAADREREALLAISEQLEYLEDKLREYRFLEPSDVENKAVLLGQLDGVRRELVEVVDRCMPHVLFGKEVVREVLAFSQVMDDSGEEGEEQEGLEDEQLMEMGQEGDLLGAAEDRSGSPAGQHHAVLHNHSGGQGAFASEIEPDEVSMAVSADGSALPAGGTAQRALRSDMYDAEADPSLIPAVRRSGTLHRPPRYPTTHHQQQQQQQGGKEAGAGVRQHGVPAASPKRRLPSGPSTSPTSLHQQHQQQLAQMHPSPNRSAFLQHHQHQQKQQRGGDHMANNAQARFGSGGHPLSANAVPGVAFGIGSSGGAGDVAAAAGIASRLYQQQYHGDGASRVTANHLGGGAAAPSGAETYSFAPQHATVAHAAVPGSSPVAAPSSYAPSDGIPSNRQSPHSAHVTAAGVPITASAAAPAAASSKPSSSRLFLLGKLNRAQGSSASSGGRGNSASSSRHGAYRLVSDADIYGALEETGHVRPASITNPSPRQYGGFVKIKDRLNQPDGSTVPQVPGPRSPMPPRIYGESVQEGSESWEAGNGAQPAAHAARLSFDSPALPRADRPVREQHPARSAPLRAASQSRERLHLAYSSGGAGVAGRPALSASRAAENSRGGGGADGAEGRSGGGAGGFLGRLTNMLLTGAAAAAVVVVAQHAGPVVVQKGQEVASEVARKVQEQQQQLEAKRKAAQRRRREEEQKRQREQQQRAQAPAHAPGPALPIAMPWQQGGGKSSTPDIPKRPAVSGSSRMVDLPKRPPPSPGKMADLPQPPTGSPSRMVDLPKRPPGPTARMADVPPRQAAQQQQQPAGAQQKAGVADPLPPFLAAAAAAAGNMPGTPQGRSSAPGSGAVGKPGARTYVPQAGHLFPAMPPPDVSASMG